MVLFLEIHSLDPHYEKDNIKKIIRGKSVKLVHEEFTFRKADHFIMTIYVIVN